MTRKHVYRENDRVRIKTPVFVLRVGYDFDLKAEARRIGEEHYDAIHRLLEEIAPTGSEHDITSLGGKVIQHQDRMNPYDFAFVNLTQKLAFIKGRRQGLGGKERRLHTEERPEYAGAIMYVQGKRTTMTGTYYPPSGGYTWDGDYDYGPGGLQNAKGHLLLDLWPANGTTLRNLNDTFVIEAVNVEPVAAEVFEE